MKEKIGPSRLALRVNMAFDQLATSDVPKNIKDALVNVNDYSVGQLLFDFTSCVLSDKLWLDWFH